MKHLDLFSGIGGFALAVQWVWGENHNIHSFIEIDPFCQKVLKKHWPDVPIISDIKEYKHDGTAIDLLTGGFPCQPFSVAGKQRGKEDDCYLWPEMLRIISEVHPAWIIGENVAGIINMGLDQVLSDLENEGYTFQPFIIPACAVNAPHRRDRVWIVAYTSSTGARSEGRKIANEKRQTCESGGESLRQNNRQISTSRTQSANSNAFNTQGKNDRGYLRGKKKRQVPEFGNGVEQADVRNTESTGQQGGIIRPWEIQHGGTSAGSDWLEVATRLCRVDDGISSRVDRLKSLGNAIVPQVVVPIMQAIKELNK